jgi:DNA-directed RNA polymerase subunit RPC12/RpoP
MKLIIDIPDEYFEQIKNNTEGSTAESEAVNAIRNGISYEERLPDEWIRTKHRLNLLIGVLFSNQLISENYIEYIEDSIKKLMKGSVGDTLLNAIDNAPAVDAISNEEGYEMYGKGYLQGYERGKGERTQGEWIHLQAIGDYKCSICGCENLYKYANEHERWVKTNSNFCPNCGSQMKKGDSV